MKIYEVKMILVTENHINKNDIEELVEEFSDNLSEIEDLSISNFHSVIKSSKNKYPDVDRDNDNIENFENNFNNWIIKSQKIIDKQIKKK